MMPDHVHMLISIPPKYSVAQVIGFIKGKSAIHIARNYLGHRRNFTGQQFWARGYHVSTVGLDEDAVREYIRSQEREDQRVEQLSLFKYATFEVAHKITALSGSQFQASGFAGGNLTFFRLGRTNYFGIDEYQRSDN